MLHPALRTILVGTLVAVIVASCAGGATPGPTSTPTIDPATPAAATANAKATTDAQATADAQATVNAKATADTKATADAQATAEVGATSTAVSQLTATQEAIHAKATADMAAKQTKTAEAIAQKTAAAQPMLELVQKMVTDGYLTSAEGTFQTLPDFNESVAMINYISPFPTKLSPKQFVLRTDMAWESASNKANWFNSACGFIFHMDPKDFSFYSATLSLDGYVNIDMHKPNYSNMTKIGRWYYDKLDTPKGKAEFVLIVTFDQITVFVNGKMVHSYKSELKYTSGMLAYSITSGTNLDYGTRCKLTNIQIWELK